MKIVSKVNPTSIFFSVLMKYSLTAIDYRKLNEMDRQKVFFKVAPPPNRHYWLSHYCCAGSVRMITNKQIIVFIAPEKQKIHISPLNNQIYYSMDWSSICPTILKYIGIVMNYTLV